MAPDLTVRISVGTDRMIDLHARLASRQSHLPLRFWRQQAHFTTPAADESMAIKALTGTAPLKRALDRHGLSSIDLADRLGVDPALVTEMLEHPRLAPLVMLDGEDAQALREDVSAEGLRVASSLLRNRSRGTPNLRFFRPPGFNLRQSANELLTMIASVSSERECGLDGIVFPKVQHPEEVALLYELLDEAEAAADLPNGHLRVALLIESGWAVAQLGQIAAVAATRLCALIFGLADYSADLGLPEIDSKHEVAAWARAEIVNAAGSVGVPAIDAMTLAYPVTDSTLDVQANRERFLDRMALAYEDAVGARRLGMLGKWVGHPAQLFAVLLAFEAGMGADVLEPEAAKVSAYRRVVEEEGRGATMIAGIMSDRATDRHARAVLRQAVALGRFSPDRALELGVIHSNELADALALAAPPSGNQEPAR